MMVVAVCFPGRGFGLRVLSMDCSEETTELGMSDKRFLDFSRGSSRSCKGPIMREETRCIPLQNRLCVSTALWNCEGARGGLAREDRRHWMEKQSALGLPKSNIVVMYQKEVAWEGELRSKGTGEEILIPGKGIYER